MTAASGRTGSGRHEWMGAVLCAVFLLLPGASRAQGESGAGERLDAAARAKRVERVCAALNEHYVFPDVARKMEAALRKKLKAGAYDKLSNSADFAHALTRDLLEVSKDKHLRIHYVPSAPPGLDFSERPSPALQEQRRREMAFRNFGFEKVERLAGNVGYLELRGFMGAELAGETAISAMNFLAHSDAVIIDLRKNGGGDPSMIQLLSSYFFEEPTHLNSFYLRKENTTHQFWTSAHVAGKRMTDVPLYVLTSPATFSAAEEFTYNLKNLKRATIVGETTGGGAHPVQPHVLADVHLVAFVPFGRAVNPITGTNWEGTGVVPDLQVPADKALEAAHRDALKKLQDKAQDAKQKQQLAWALQKVEALATPVTPGPEVLKSFAGSYGQLTLSYETGSLWFSWPGFKLRALPMTADTFMIDDGRDLLRVRMEKDASGRVTGLTELYEDGRTEHTARSGS